MIGRTSARVTYVDNWSDSVVMDIGAQYREGLPTLSVSLNPEEAYELAAKLMRYAAKADQDECRCSSDDDDTDYR